MTEYKRVLREDEFGTSALVRLPQIYLKCKDCVSIKLEGLFLEIHQVIIE